jgi:hypothetical protein
VDEILDITLFVTGTLERLGIPYLIGGSLASSLHGMPRATQDVDIVVRMSVSDVPAVAGALDQQFYLDEDAMRDAVQQYASFNIIHLGTYFKADIFVAKDDEVSRLQMARSQRFELPGHPRREIVVASPEDGVAQKLWFSLSVEVAERQWRDAIGVLKVAGPRLDMVYLRRAAALLGVEGLLRRACIEAGVQH